MMDVNFAINNLKEFIYKAYDLTTYKIGSNIYRGHLRALSTEIEDGIALFISELFPNYRIFIDSSIHINGKKHRPDILVIDENNNVKVMIEIKSNMGWCRKANSVIDNIFDNDKKFLENHILHCEFSRNPSQDVIYESDVKLFLIALTNGNCSAKNHKKNKEYAALKKVHQFNLFSGWYAELFDYEISDFANELLK